jgi:hypothetical protein
MKTAVLFVWMATVPASALAQGAVAGWVTDSSGARLPAVLVESTSPALIEKTRRTVTDGAGSYRIENLRPGTYSVRFTLPGWRPYQRDDVALTDSFTTTVNAQLILGPAAETVVVTGASPVVDVHSATSTTTLSAVVKSIPTVRSYNALVGLVPGVVTSSNDVVTGTAAISFPIHGGRSSEGRLFVDGLNIGSPPAGNSATSYTVDVGHAEEISLSEAGMGEVETAGLVLNLVPKAGGNRTVGSFFASASGAALQSDNLTPALKRQGVAAATPLKKVYDVDGSLGGPIAKDRIWYFADAHSSATTKESTNVYYNRNAADAKQWLYVPDPSRREYSDRTFESVSGRVTWQVSPRNKVSGFVDVQTLCRRCTGATPGLSEPARVSPEAVGVLGRPLYVTQATWSSPRTDRLLLEAGYGGTFFGVGNFERLPNPTRGLIRVEEQCANGCAANGGIPGLVYRSQDFSIAHTGSYQWQGSLSYVTGTHSVKAGYQHVFMTDDRTWFTNDQNLTYRVDNGVPNQLTESISPWVNDTRAAWDGLYVQERWTRGRATLQGAVRFDRARSWFPEQREGPSRFLPTPIVVPETPGVDSYKDLTARFGAVYDLFGNGRTAVKVALGKYLEGAAASGTYANMNPTLRMPQATMAFGTAGVTRTWIDANQNFVADCDLLNPADQDLRPVGGDRCGGLSNTSFGKNILTNHFDPALASGWGIRPSDWNLTASIEHEILARTSIRVAYVRRSFHGFSVVDNLADHDADLTPFSIVAPRDPRLPNGGGHVIPGLYDVVPGKSGQVDNFVTDSSKYGAWTQHFNGLDVTAGVRRASFTFAGGTSTGQTVADNCDVRRHLPELATTTTGTSTFGAGLLTSAVTPRSPYCHVGYGILTQFRGLTSYLFPKAGVQVAATFQSKPGAMLAANYAVANADVVPSLGRNLSDNAPNVTVNLVAPGAMYGDRINELDLRVAKLLKVGRARTVAALEIYNVLNSGAVLTYNNVFVPGGTWLQPLTILTPRFVKITMEIDF